MIYYNLISLLIAIVIIKKFNLSAIRFIALILLPMFLFEFYHQIFVGIPEFDLDFSLMYIFERTWKGILYLFTTIVIFAIGSEFLYKKLFLNKIIFLLIISVLYLFAFEFGRFNFSGNIILRLYDSFFPLAIIGFLSGVLIYLLPSTFRSEK